MKRVIVVVIVVALIVGGAVWYKASQSNEDSKVAGVATHESEFDKIQRSVASGAKLYDVRTAEEYAAGHFANATNWPLQDLQAGKFPEVAKDTELYVYCRSGNRSGQSTVLLQQAGYTDVTDLHGVASVEAMGGKLVTN